MTGIWHGSGLCYLAWGIWNGAFVILERIFLKKYLEKLPAWIRAYSGKELNFETSSGLSFPVDLQKYALIVHCGSCMLNEKEVGARNRRAAQQGVPITNYGMTIAEVNGILPRALKVLP